MAPNILPVPPHFDPSRVDQVWRVPYQQLALEAQRWRRQRALHSCCQDKPRVLLLLVDVQNTFCLPDFELFVSGRSGRGAVEDNQRLCEFFYRNLHRVTQVCLTMDTHQAFQIFHACFLTDSQGTHPEPFTTVTRADIEAGHWHLTEAAAKALGLEPNESRRYLLHYAQELHKSGKYQWTVWPYHALLGGIGHALVASVEEAVFFHSQCRDSQPVFRIKGDHPLTEQYSVLEPEVRRDAKGNTIGHRDVELVQFLESFDRIIVAGQAKSHCVAWTLNSLAQSGLQTNRFYLLEDCTSAVVVEDIVDYTAEAEEAFLLLERAGMNRVSSEDLLETWPDF